MDNNSSLNTSQLVAMFINDPFKSVAMLIWLYWVLYNIVKFIIGYEGDSQTAQLADRLVINGLANPKAAALIIASFLVALFTKSLYEATLAAGIVIEKSSMKIAENSHITQSINNRLLTEENKAFAQKV